MQVSLVRRATPLLITTMLVATPALGQSSGSQQDNGTPPTTITTPQPATRSGPSGTAQKATPHPSQAAARQPGETLQALAERRITELHTRLHITKDQSQQWEQFAQVMRDNAKEMDEIYRQRAGKLGAMSAVDNMQSFAMIEKQRAQDVEKLVPAFQTLYEALSNQQKKTADQMFRTYAANAQSRHQAAAHAK